MNISNHSYDASASMHGDKYQIYYALYLALDEIVKADNYEYMNEISLKLEGLDDIEFFKSNKTYKLIQTKHLTGKPLTDSSEHFWKTLRIWSEHIKNKKVSVIDTDFLLVITLPSSKGHILDLLEKEKFNDAFKKIEKFIRENRFKNKKEGKVSSKEKYFQAFEEVGDEKSKLIESISVITSELNLNEIQDKIKGMCFKYVDEIYISIFFEELKEWWNDRNDTNFPVISLSEINNKLRDLAYKFHRNNLPDFFEGKTLDLPSDYEEQNFVKQLRKLKFDDNILEEAKSDYYRTKRQRSEWENNIRCISPTDIIDYENLLVQEHWKRIKNSRYSEFKFKNDIDDLLCCEDEKKLQELGRYIYEETLKDFVPFKGNGRKYFMYGSYHELANKNPIPKVYWHPKFLDFLKSETE